jgi:hypothetical protein
MKSNLEDCGRLLADVSEKLKKFVEFSFSLQKMELAAHKI